MLTLALHGNHAALERHVGRPELQILLALQAVTAISAVAGGVLLALGLVAFEVVEFLTIGFQPLEAVFAVVGALVVVLALRVGMRDGEPWRA